MTQPSTSFDLGGAIQGVLAANPSLGQTPELALGVAQSPDPMSTAEVAGQASNVMTVHDVAQQHAQTSSAGHAGLFGTLAHFAHVAVRDTESAVGSGLSALKSGGGQVLSALAKPLQDVQHDYRYIRAVYDRHGAAAGTLELLGIAAAAGVGGFLGGGPGAILAGDAAASLEQRLFYRGTSAITKKAYTDSNGNEVSFGRDLAHLANYVSRGHVQNNPGHFDAFDLISGLGDTAFDIGLDPLLGASRIKAGVDLLGSAKLAEMVGGDSTAVGRRIATGRANSVVGPSGSRVIAPFDSADDIMRVYVNRPDVARSFDRLAGMSSGQIATQLPKLAPLAPELGAASTPQEIASVFHRAATVQEYTRSSVGLPKTGITRGALSRLNAGIYSRLEAPAFNPDGTAKMIGDTDQQVMGLSRLGRAYNLFQSYRPFAFDPELAKIDTTSFDPNSRHAFNAISRVMRYSQSPQTVAKVMDAYLAAGASDPATQAAVYKNAVIDTLRAAGLADTHPLIQQMRAAMEDIGVGGKDDIYALDQHGLNISDYRRPDGTTINAGLWGNQTGRFAFPNFQAIRNTLRDDSGGAIGALGRADQFVASKYMSTVFKPLALLSLGFAQRVSLAELLPGSLALGARKVLGTELLNFGRKLAPADYARQVDLHTADIGGDAERAATQTIPAAMTAPITGEEIAGHVSATPGVTLLPGEDEHVAAAAAKTLFDSVWGKPVLKAGTGQLGKGLMRLSSALLDQDYRDVVMNLTVRHDGHLLNPALAAGEQGIMHDTDPATELAANIYRIGAHVPPKYQVGDGFATYKTSDAKHPAFWAAALREPANDASGRLMAQTLLNHGVEGSTARAAAEAAHDDWLATVRASTSADDAKYLALVRVQENDPLFAQKKYEALMGLVTGEDGTVNRDLLQSIADGKVPDLATLRQIPLPQRPAMVKGAALNQVGQPSTFDRLVAQGFRPLEAIINSLSREPLYAASVTKEYKFLKPLVDAGTLSVDDAMRMAEQRAVPNMLPLIHNTKLRNQFSDVFRNVMPFYFAQEQAARRYGSVVLSDPQAAAKLLLVHHAIADTGIIRTDPSDPSQKYVVMPGGDMFGRGLASAFAATGILGVQTGIPTQFSGNLQSLKTVVPEGNLPSLSPVISVPLKLIEERFPEASDVISPVIGPIAESSTSIWSQILPSSSARSFITAVRGDAQSASFTTAYGYAAMNAIRTGKLREDMSPPQRDIELAKIRNTARIYFLAKSVLAAVSPLSPKMDVGDLPLRQELTRTIKANGGDFAKGMDAFLRAHPDATPSTVFESESKVGGALPPSTGETTRFLSDHQDLVGNYAYAAPFFIPQGVHGNYDPTAQNMELALGLRQRKTTERMVETAFIAQGASEYFDKEHQYQAALKTLQDAGQTDQARSLTAGWQSWSAGFKVAHPSFATDLGSQTGTRTVDGVQALKDMSEIFAKGLAPASPQADLVRTLFDQYQQYAQAYKQFSAVRDSTSTAALYKGWQAHLDQFAIDNPAAKQVIRTVFARLPRPVPDLSQDAGFQAPA